MILYCSYEELEALRWGARSLLEEEGWDGSRAVAAPPGALAEVERLLPRLHGDLTVETLAEQRRIVRAMETIVARLRAEMESRVTALHPAAEGAVQAYFDFAHALSALDRLRALGREMEAILDVLMGDDAAEDEVADSFVFPD